MAKGHGKCTTMGSSRIGKLSSISTPFSGPFVLVLWSLFIYLFFMRIRSIYGNKTREQRHPFQFGIQFNQNRQIQPKGPKSFKALKE